MVKSKSVENAAKNDQKEQSNRVRRSIAAGKLRARKRKNFKREISERTTLEEQALFGLEAKQRQPEKLMIAGCRGSKIVSSLLKQWFGNKRPKMAEDALQLMLESAMNIMIEVGSRMADETRHAKHVCASPEELALAISASPYHRVIKHGSRGVSEAMFAPAESEAAPKVSKPKAN